MESEESDFLLPGKNLPHLAFLVLVFALLLPLFPFFALPHHLFHCFFTSRQSLSYRIRVIQKVNQHPGKINHQETAEMPTGEKKKFLALLRPFSLSRIKIVRVVSDPTLDPLSLQVVNACRHIDDAYFFRDSSSVGLEVVSFPPMWFNPFRMRLKTPPRISLEETLTKTNLLGTRELVSFLPWMVTVGLPWQRVSLLPRYTSPRFAHQLR